MKHTFIGALLFSGLTVFGQHGGNYLTEQNNNNYYQPQIYQGISNLYLSDSTFVIDAKVLTNVIADNYVVTIAVSEAAKTLKEANTKIDERIQNFTATLKTKFDIPASDIYIDMTTQTQISDYKVNGNYSEQFISGYEQKKNVIIKLKSIKDLNKIVITASEFEIYDLAKVDYIVTDINKIYTQLFQAAMEVINSKKDLYVKATNITLKPRSEMYAESFYSITPSQLYKSYTPNITTEYIDYNPGAKRKELRKTTTYFYDHISYSDFDKVINPVMAEPTVEFVLTLQLKFNSAKGTK